VLPSVAVATLLPLLLPPSVWPEAVSLGDEPQPQPNAIATATMGRTLATLARAIEAAAAFRRTVRRIVMITRIAIHVPTRRVEHFLEVTP
jgi:hypothetical protein